MLEKIKSLLPYSKPFLFVDGYTSIDENGAKGHYTFKENEYFYQGHFKDNPITPGVILIETMAQIGLVGLGLFLMKVHESPKPINFAFTSSEVDFLKKVLPNEKVEVVSEKIYFRFKKLKCKVIMRNAKGEIVCQGTLAGMVI